MPYCGHRLVVVCIEFLVDSFPYLRTFYFVMKIINLDNIAYVLFVVL